MAATVVLVHGAWHGAWCWEGVRGRLDAAGVKSVAVDLPSVKSAKAGLKQDADHVKSVLDGIDGEVVLVGHSYGGAVITEAGVHPSVHQLVYLAAYALDEGESCADNDLEGAETGSDLEPAIQVGDGVSTLDPELAIPALYADCTEEVARAAAARLRSQSDAGPAGVVTAVAWRHVPASYVVCTEDRAVPPALQRSAAARVRTIVDMPTSHSPFLSRPELVADLLTGIARA